MIWLIGAGPMAIDYAKVLDAQSRSFMCITRSEQSASSFISETGIRAFVGGLQKFLLSEPDIPEHAIVATDILTLCQVIELLIRYGIKSILVEKPAGLNIDEIEHTQKLVKQYQAKLFVAYNRRFYAAIIAAQKMIAEDGGVTSLNFEITEWAHVIEGLNITTEIKQNWFMANTSHVVDLAFYLGGRPKKISCFTGGAVSWHPNAAMFAGAGVTESDALFSYHGNWNAPGRWSIDILTAKRRFIFRPLEKLQIQQVGEIKIEMFEINDELDIAFKPGVYLQVQTFLKGNRNALCSINEHMVNSNYYCKMANYDI